MINLYIFFKDGTIGSELVVRPLPRKLINQLSSNNHYRKRRDLICENRNDCSYHHVIFTPALKNLFTPKHGILDFNKIRKPRRSFNIVKRARDNNVPDAEGKIYKRKLLHIIELCLEKMILIIMFHSKN